MDACLFYFAGWSNHNQMWWRFGALNYEMSICMKQQDFFCPIKRGGGRLPSNEHFLRTKTGREFPKGLGAPKRQAAQLRRKLPAQTHLDFILAPYGAVRGRILILRNSIAPP
jgi:hypothetical protein